MSEYITIIVEGELRVFPNELSDEGPEQTAQDALGGMGFIVHDAYVYVPLPREDGER